MEAPLHLERRPKQLVIYSVPSDSAEKGPGERLVELIQTRRANQLTFYSPTTGTSDTIGVETASEAKFLIMAHLLLVTASDRADELELETTSTWTYECIDVRLSMGTFELAEVLEMRPRTGPSDEKDEFQEKRRTLATCVSIVLGDFLKSYDNMVSLQ